jgi:hypothetical protein
MSKIKIKFWHYGLTVTALISVVLGYHLLYDNKQFFLAGETSYAHYQFELECNHCHTKSFNTMDDIQEACETCHAHELDRFNDSHPKEKFIDPRNSALLEQLDARYCITCHTEHKPEITRSSSVTVAPDFCFHCHQTIKEERPSHKDFTFDSCASAGCHNYHDNSMLYEEFMLRHLGEPNHLSHQTLPLRNALKLYLRKNPDTKRLSINDHNATQDLINASIIQQWSNSAHAISEVNCLDCHNAQDANTTSHSLAAETCNQCHKKQVEQFYQSHHGLRLGIGLPPMNTAEARLTMKNNLHKEVTCSSCHDPHSLDTEKASVDACLTCHQDEHSINYKDSPHFNLWQKELSNELSKGSGVTCASCHLPRIKKGKKVTVDHNQSAYVRPSNKMLRKVCMNCHGLEFSLSALIDQNLIKNNFNGSPSTSLKTIELLKQRLKQRQQRQNPDN